MQIVGFLMRRLIYKKSSWGSQQNVEVSFGNIDGAIELQTKKCSQNRYVIFRFYLVIVNKCMFQP